MTIEGKSVINPEIELAGKMTGCNVEQAKRVYDPNNIGPTISAGGGTGSIPKVDVSELEKAILRPERNEYGKAIRSAFEKGLIEESRHKMRDLVPRKDEISNTITTAPKDNLLAEGNLESIRWPSATQKGYMEAHEGDGIVMQRPHVARGTVQPQTSPTLTTQQGGGSGAVVKDNTRADDTVLCIRYLTPRECFRLMGQSEDAIDRIMEAEPSKTRQYKMAENSIVVDVLVDIFRGIYIEKTFGKRERRPSLEDFL